jgi:hypothetical protein
MTTTAPSYTAKYNVVDGTWDVVDKDGEATFSYDVQSDASSCAAELNNEESLDEAKTEAESLLCDCTDLAKLRQIVRILKEGPP